MFFVNYSPCLKLQRLGNRGQLRTELSGRHTNGRKTFCRSKLSTTSLRINYNKVNITLEQSNITLEQS
jgi:hypothetical protein